MKKLRPSYRSCSSAPSQQASFQQSGVVPRSVLSSKKVIHHPPPANYRLIFLTCILCKVLEHIMASHLVKHLDKHDLLYDLQHGFREKRSCETQLTMLIENLVRNTSAGKQTDLVLLDFSNAFDKVNHPKLIWKLHQYGIRENVLSWIRAFPGHRL